jgi:hypothetical protein
MGIDQYTSRSHFIRTFLTKILFDKYYLGDRQSDSDSCGGLKEGIEYYDII